MIRWGILGPGTIAARFAEGMRDVTDGSVVAVASRSPERAGAFAERFDVPARYGSYDALVGDDDVDVVYVATPHAQHEAHALLCIEAGKHVLCEKPFALSAAQADRMASAARAAGVFLMEAMWSRFLPAYRILADLLADATIGQPQVVEADFGFRMPVIPDHRLFDPALGGGALLDLGVYPLQLASMVLGRPQGVLADGIVGETGVDEVVAALTRHPGGGIGVLKAAIRADLACTARITGTDGWIDLPAFMHCPTSLTVSDREVVDASFEGEGLRFQVEEVHCCLAAGLRESTVMPLDETVALASVLDQVRAQLGVRYPGE